MYIIINPEYKAQRDEVDRLRSALTALLLERVQMEQVECVNLEAMYLMKFGGLEFQIYKVYCGILRENRKRELVQAAVNRQEPIHLDTIDAQLDKEFGVYEAQLNQKMKDLKGALKWKESAVLTEEEQEELKKLYRQIVKALHPDLNPGINGDERALFLKAVDAYKNGDLETMRLIADLVRGKNTDFAGEDLMEQLAAEAKRVREAIEKVNASMDEMRESYPYNQKDLLDDPAAISKKREELKDMLSRYEEELKRQTQETDDLIRQG